MIHKKCKNIVPVWVQTETSMLPINRPKNQRRVNDVAVLDNAKKVPWKRVKDVELELIWKDHIAYFGKSKIYVYEEDTEHAKTCKCCTPLWQCNRNDEERRQHNIKSKIKRPDTNTQHIDRGMLFPKVNIPIEQEFESLTIQFPGGHF
jgi:hypothetical protein